MKNPTGSRPKGRPGPDNGGGLSHVYYGHKARPVWIEIKCPNCSGHALAADVQAAKLGLIINTDISDSGFNDCLFQVRCYNCRYKGQIKSYFNLTEPFIQIEGNGDILWAFNYDHLEMIYLFLSGVDTTKNPYHYFNAYIHSNWKKHKKSYCKKIDAWREKNLKVLNILKNHIVPVN